MANNLKLSKAMSFKKAGDLLVKEGKRQEAIHLYWTAIRGLIFYQLEESNIPYQSTSEAIVKYIEANNDSESARILSMYSFGIQAGWEESFECSFSQEEQKEIIVNQITLYEKLTDDITDKYLNLWSLNNILYKASRRYYECARKFKIAILIISLLVMFLPYLFSRSVSLPSDNQVQHTNVSIAGLSALFLFFIACLLAALNFYQTQKSKKLYQQAERLRNYLFLKGVYPEDLDTNDEASILGTIDLTYLNEAKEKAPPSNNPNNYLETTDTQTPKLVFRLQENTFFTYMLFERFSKHIQKDIYKGAIAFFVIIIVFLSCFLVFGQDEKMVLLFPRMLAAIVSFIFAIDYFSYYLSFRNKSEILKVIDARLEKMTATPNEKQILALYDHYNSILWDNPPMEGGFFDLHKDNLNELVNRRMLNAKTIKK